jgi:anti-sigma factor RsiW
MTCDECRQDLSALLDRELDVFHRRAVEAHLEACAGCREDVAALERTIMAVQDAPPVPEDLLPTRAVLARLPALQVVRERAVERATTGAAVAGVLGLGLMVGLGLFLSQVHLTFRLLARGGALFYTLAGGGMAPWSSRPLLGWELLGVTTVVLAFSGWLLFGMPRRGP